MSAAAPVPGRVSIWLPRPLWIGVATIALVIVAVGLRIGMPIYRQQVVIQEIEQLGGKIESRHAGPQWLRDRLGYERAELLDEVFSVSLSDTRATDATVARLNDLP